MKIHDTLYMPRKCMDGGDKNGDVVLFTYWNNFIYFILFLNVFQNEYDKCYSGMEEGNKMIISEDFDIKLRAALAIHYGLNKVYVDKIRINNGNVYRIKIKINSKFEWDYCLDESFLLVLRDCFVFEDIVEILIDKFEEDKTRCNK